MVPSFLGNSLENTLDFGEDLDLNSFSVYICDGRSFWQEQQGQLLTDTFFHNFFFFYLEPR